MKSYRFVGEEMEVLGQRLDAARAALKAAENSWATKRKAGINNGWAVNYWRQAVEQLESRWKKLPILHDADAQMSIIPRYEIDYDFYEVGHKNEGHGVTDRFYNAVFNHDANLDASWNAHREARLAKAQ